MDWTLFLFWSFFGRKQRPGYITLNLLVEGSAWCKREVPKAMKHVQQHSLEKHCLVHLGEIYWRWKSDTPLITMTHITKSNFGKPSVRVCVKPLTLFTWSRGTEKELCFIGSSLFVWRFHPAFHFFFCLFDIQLSVYLFLSCSLLISLVWIINSFSSLLVEREFSSSWISSRDVWFRTCKKRIRVQKKTWGLLTSCLKSNFSDASEKAGNAENSTKLHFSFAAAIYSANSSFLQCHCYLHLPLPHLKLLHINI